MQSAIVIAGEVDRLGFRTVDEDGELTRDELLSALKLVGVSNIIDIDKVMAEADADGNGTIDIFEFMAYLTMNTSKMMGLVDTRANAPQRNAKAMADEVLRTQSEMSQSLVIGDDLWLVHPQSLFSSYWDVALSLVLLVTVITVPLSLAFDLTPLAFNLSVDGLFFLDFVKNFVTGFVDEDEFVVMRFRSTAHKYGRSWAVPDLIAFVPFYLLPHTDFFGSSNNVLKLFRLMRLGKVFRLLRASSLISQVNRFKQIIEDRLQIRVDEGIVALSKLSLTVIVSAHWMGCINWMICREFDFPEDSWVTSSGLEFASVAVQYNWCFFKALSQMVTLGFEDGAPVASTTCVARAGDEGRAPSNWCTIEHWITLACVYVGSVLYAVLISNVSSIVYNLNMGQRTLHEKVTQVNEYMRSKRLPVEIRDKVRDYYRLRFSEGKMYHEADILKELSPGLREDILRFNSKELFKKVPLLGSSPHAFGAKLASALLPSVHFKDECIFFEDSRGDTMYFIYTGVVEVSSKYKKNAKGVLTVIGDGACAPCAAGSARGGRVFARSRADSMRVCYARRLLLWRGGAPALVPAHGDADRAHDRVLVHGARPRPRDAASRPQTRLSFHVPDRCVPTGARAAPDHASLTLVALSLPFPPPQHCDASGASTRFGPTRTCSRAT